MPSNAQRAIPRERLLNEQHSRFKQVFFLIWPAATFIYSLFSLNSPSSRFIVILFYGLCGYFYPFSFSDNIDVVRHAERFREAASIPAFDFFNRVTTLYVSDSNKPDIVQPFLEFVISRFTTDYRIYFAILGLLLGYFLMTLIKILYEDYNKQLSKRFLLLLILFIVILLPPYRISGFRQILGTLFFCIGVYQVLVNNKKIFHLLVLSSCLVHFGFLILMPFYLLYFLIRHRFILYFVLILLAFVFKGQAVNMIGDVGADLQGQLGSRIRGYTSVDYMEKTTLVGQSQLGIIRHQIPYTAYFFFLLLLYFFAQGNLKKSPESTALYAMILSIFIFITFITDLHNTLVRFSLVFVLLSVMLCSRIIKNSQNYISLPKMFLVVVISINSIVMLRKAIEFTGVQVLAPNIVLTFFLDTHATVLDLIKK